MAVRKEKDGTWTIDVYINGFGGTKKRYKKRGFPSKREASACEHSLSHAEIASSEPFSFYLEQLSNNSNASAYTREKKKSGIIKHANEIFNVPIDKITKVNLLNWRMTLNSTKLATKTKNIVISNVKSVFKFANNVYGVNDISTVLTLFKKTNEETIKEYTVWTNEDFNKFIKESPNEIFTAYFTLLFNTGMRRGEALALYKEDIDLETNTVFIKKSIRSNKEGVKAPKTLNSRRKIKIDRNTLETLKCLLNEPGQWLFGDYEAIGSSTIDRTFKKMIRSSGVSSIRIHDLRHSHATILINGGVNIVAVSKRLGHTDVSMTLKVYTHLLHENEEKLIHFIENSAKLVPNEIQTTKKPFI